MHDRKPGLLSRTKKCTRCGMRYSKDASSCPHCRGLDDDQLMMLKARQRQRASKHDGFDKLMMFVVALIIVVMIIVSL